MAIMGDNVFERYARNPADAMASAFWGKRLDQQLQPNSDPWAREEERRRNQRLAEWELANSLPQHLANSVQNTMIARPDQMGLGLAGARAWDDISQARPMASPAMADQMAAQFWGAYAPQPPAPRPAPVQPQVPMHNQAAAMQQAFSGALPGVGKGSVNGQDALYPIHGQVPQYQQSMMHLQADPNNISVFDPGALSAAMDGMQARDYQAKMAGSEADPKVIAARAKALEAQKAAELEKEWRQYVADRGLTGKQYAADQGLAGRQYSADKRNEGTHYASDTRAKSWAEHDKAKSQQVQFQEQEKNRRTRTNGVGVMPTGLPAPGMQQQPSFLKSMMDAFTGGAQMVQQGPGGAGILAPGGGGVEYDNSHPIGPHGYDAQGNSIGSSPQNPLKIAPQVKDTLSKLPPFARQKFLQFSKSPGFEKDFYSDTPEAQMRFLQHLVTGR